MHFNNNNNNNLNIFMQDCCFSFKKKTAINAGPVFSCHSRAKTAKECIKKHVASAKLLFCSLNLLFC